MPEIKEHIEYLSQDIGPRPAGTEEEQKAALYIADQFQNEAGLEAKVEDFNGVGDPEMVSLIYGAIAVLFGLLAVIVPGLGLIWLIGSLIGAGLLVADIMGHPILSNILGKGVSQNVVAKYEPGDSQSSKGARKRKVIIVARYDSGKVRKELSPHFVALLPLIIKGSTIAVIAMPVLLLIKCVLLGSTGAIAGFFTILIVIALILAAVPIALAVLHRAADYNEGANNNASGVAAMLEVARRVGTGRVSEAELAQRDDAVMHGEAAAYENGLVPEGSEFVYSGDSTGSGEGLAAAKAAIAALSGKPVSGVSEEDIANNLDMIEEQEKHAASGVESAQYAAETEGMSAQQAAPVDEFTSAVPEAAMADDMSAAQTVTAAAAEQSADVEPIAPITEQSQASSGVPDWFRKAQEKAKKSKQTAEKPAQRSRYATALDAVAAEGTGQFAQAANAVAKEAAPAAAQATSAPIHEVHAPKWGVIDPVEPVDPAEYAEQTSKAADKDVVSEKPASASAREVEPVQTSEESPAIPEAAVTNEMPALSAEPTEQDAFESVPESVAATEFAQAADPASETEPVAESNVAPAQKQTPVIPVSADPSATVATPPIDVSALNIDGANVKPVTSAPAFLDPLKVQAEKQASQPVSPRSINRVDATEAEITSMGVVDQSTLVAETPFAVPARNTATDTGAVADTANATSAAAGASLAAAAPVQKRPTRRPIMLPDLPDAEENAAPVISQAKQRAPLADVEESGKTAAKSLLRTLPTIGSADVLGAEGVADGAESAGAAAATPNRAKNASLLVSLPSLSGAIKAADSAQDQAKNAAVPAAGSAGASGAFAPVTDELIREASLEDKSDDLYIDDVDDSDYDTDFTQTGALAGPGYVEMPKSRVRKFFDKFRRDKSDIDETPQEWLDVDDSFDARSVGQARGSWESFRDDNYDNSADAYADGAYANDGYANDYAGNDYADGYGNDGYSDAAYENAAYDNGDYNNGTFANQQAFTEQPVQAGQDYASDAYAGADGAAYDDGYADATQAFPPYSQIDDAATNNGFVAQPFANQSKQADFFDDGFDADDIYDEAPKKKRFRPWHGGAFSPRRMEEADIEPADSGNVPAATEEGLGGYSGVDSELEQIYKFRNPDINTEVWFVALGSEMAGNAGMKAFMAEHERDLKGAFIVQLDALGAGELTLIDQEGTLKPSKPSSRMKRYLRKASQATGVKTASAPLLWEESAASWASKHGLQAVHLVGMEGGKPVAYGEAGDVVEAIDDETLASNTNFVMELLKNF